ncbi:MAG: tRNA lysidine(34) synthetase TilS [Leptospirillia bacterium]
MTGETLITRLRRAITERALAAPGDTVLVAVSGGVDSTVLLHALTRLAPELGLTLHAAHLNHALRGAESDADQDFVIKTCARLGVPCSAEKRRVDRRPDESPQEAARRVRYAFLNEVADRIGAARIATGHHADDLAETVVMRLISGAGSRGLSGLAQDDGFRIRPMLDQKKSDIVAWANDNHIAHREDASNADARYLRNRIRQRVMPELAEINPGIAGTLSRTAHLLAEEDGYLDMQARAAYGKVAGGEHGGQLLDRTRLCALHPALARRVVHAALTDLLPGDIALAHVEAVTGLISAVSGTGVDLPGGVRAEVVYNVIEITPQTAATPDAAEAPLVVQVPGKTAVTWAGFTLEAAYREPDNTPGWVYFDPDTFTTPLSIRRRMSGDRFCPAGMDGHAKKLKNFLIDRKVPRRERELTPLLTSPEGVMWVVGLRQDDRFVVKEKKGEAGCGIPLAFRIHTNPTC